MNAKTTSLRRSTGRTLAIAMILTCTGLSLCAGEDRRTAGARGDARPPGNGAQTEKERTVLPSQRDPGHRNGIANDIRREIEKKIRITAEKLGIWIKFPY